MGWAIAIVIGLVIGVAAVAGVIYGSRTKIYNDLVSKRNKVSNAWAHVEVQLQRRFDLVPSLVEAVKGVAAQERYIFDSLNSTLSKFFNAHSNHEKMAVDAELSTQLKALYSMVQNYPQVQTSRNFMQLQAALTEVEEDISYARQFYNDAVTIYNNALQQHPANTIAAKHGFYPEDLFTAVQGADKAPKIFFNTKNICPVCGATSDGSSPECKHCGASLA